MARSKKSAPSLSLEFTENIVELSAADQLERDYFAYSRQVIEDRAVPAAADGLKPVQRRILWDMQTQGFFPNRPFMKVARVTGDTMALFHPHGDRSIEDALTRMAQPFSLLVPLLDFHGNYGSPDFDAAAARYTETRLGPIGMLLLGDINQRTVPMVENYEGSTEEPLVLPAEFPHTLINGSSGIAVGLTSYLPPHDPTAVCRAALHLIANKSATVDELVEIIGGPSFPSPCVVTNGDELIDIYRAGQGRVVVRGTWIVEDLPRGKQQLVITSLPYADTMTGSNDTFVEKCADAIDAGDVQGVVSPNDESSNGQTRITLQLASGVNADAVIPALLKFTNLQVSNKVQMHFLDHHGTVRLYNLRTLLIAWIEHRIRVITQRSENRIAKIDERLHRLRGFLTVLIDIDETIRIVRSSKSRATARPALMERFGIDEEQANAVLDLSLGQLTEDAVIEFRKEAEELDKERARLARMLASPVALRRQVGVELEQVMPAFEGVPNVTLITTEALQKVSKAAMVLDEPATVLISGDGYVVAQRNGSRGKAAKISPVRTIETSTAQNLVVLTGSGRLFRALVASVPNDKPTAAPNVFSGLETGDRIVGWWTDDTLPVELVVAVSDGSIKRTATADLDGGDRRGGIPYVKVPTGHAVVSVFETPDDSVMMATAAGLAIRFGIEDVAQQGRSGSGVRGIKLSDKDRVVGALPVNDETEVVIVHGKGAAKRTIAEEYPVQGRGGKGLKATGGDPKRHGPVTILTDGAKHFVKVGDDWIEANLSGVTITSRDGAPSKIRAIDGIITDVT